MAAVIYYFNAYNAGEAWETNPGNMIDGTDNSYAETTNYGEVQLLNGNTCPGTNLGTITKVEIQAYGYKTYTGLKGLKVNLRPVFAGGDGSDHNAGFVRDSPGWGVGWIDITSDTNAPAWTWGAVDGLDCDVICVIEIGASFPHAYCGEVQIRVTYTPTPVIPVPRPTAAVGNPLIF